MWRSIIHLPGIVHVMRRGAIPYQIPVQCARRCWGSRRWWHWPVNSSHPSSFSGPMLASSSFLPLQRDRRPPALAPGPTQHAISCSRGTGAAVRSRIPRRRAGRCGCHAGRCNKQYSEGECGRGPSCAQHGNSCISSRNTCASWCNNCTEHCNNYFSSGCHCGPSSSSARRR